MAAPQDVLRWWEDRYRVLSPEQREAFLDKPLLALLADVDDEIVRGAIDNEPKIDSFVPNALVMQVRRLRIESRIPVVLDRSVVTREARHAEERQAGTDHTRSTGDAAPGSIDGWSTADQERAGRMLAQRFSLAAIANAVGKPPDEVRAVLPLIVFVPGSRSTTTTSVDSSDPAARMASGPAGGRSGPSRSAVPARRKPKQKQPLSSVRRGGSIAGVSHAASGFSGKARSMAAEYDNREECSSCGALIDPASASLHECWG